MATLALLGSGVRAESAPELQASFVDPDSPEARPYRYIGARSIDRLAVTLITDVSNAVLRNGPVAALDQCHLKDIPMKDGLVGGMSQITGMKLTSLKLRNPNNAPDAAEKLALEKVKSDLESGVAPAVVVQRVTLPSGAIEWRVYKPLANIRQCGDCHAAPAAMPDDLREALAKKYPSDQATGYELGDWRGLVRVTVSDPPPPPAPAASPAPVTNKKTKKS